MRQDVCAEILLGEKAHRRCLRVVGDWNQSEDSGDLVDMRC